jgi:predicted transcriptional regulator
MARVTITQAELLDALATASVEPEDARTLAEISAETGVAEKRCRDALHALNAAKRLVVHRVTRIALDGRRATVPAYTILPAKKAKR